MPTFSYVAKDVGGKTLKGVLDTESRAKLIETLRTRNLVIVSIDEKAAKRAVASRSKVKSSELVVFSRQLATMVDSGIPLVQALDVLSTQSENKEFQSILSKVRDDVEVGTSLSDAFSRHPRTFSDLFVNMVKAGESSGQLDEIMDRLAGYLEKANALQRKVKSALVYPALVTIVAFSITTALLVFVIPRFAEIFSSLGGDLPMPTLILLAISDALRNNFWTGLLGLGVLIPVVRRRLKKA